jgi:two-component system, NtrC family, nitrogen regulation sensor histidine kinase NtrY
MTSLRTRLAIAFVVTALLPMGVLGLLAQQMIVDRTRDAHARQLDGRVDAARRRLAERAEADRNTLDRLCGHDLVVDGLLLDLAARRYGPTTEARMERLLPPLMASLSFDALVLLDAGAPPARGRVLGSGHYPERVGERDLALLSSLGRAPNRPFVATVRVRGENGLAEDREMVLGGCFIARDGSEVAIAAGRTLESYVADVDGGDGEPVRIALVGPEGALAADVGQGGGTREVAVLEDAAGAPVARVVAALDDRDLDAQLDDLRARNLGVGAAAVVLALSLAGVLAIRMTRPLRELEQAAQRVGRGDLGSTVDGTHGGREVTRAFEAFNEMTRELDRARARLRRAERIAAWRDIARRIAHEIKNPLSPIQVSIETMRKTKSKNHPEFDEIFEESTLTILEEVERLKRIVGEFSDFARLPRPRPVDVPLRELAEHVARLHTGDRARVRVAGEEATVRADREQLTQVLVNLVQNGLLASGERHGERGGEVLVTVRERKDGGADITVDDDGAGVPEEIRVRIFDPYFTTRAHGTGLGLAIVHRIVGEHGGSIEIEESPLGGARFRVRLKAMIPPESALESAADASITLP